MSRKKAAPKAPAFCRRYVYVASIDRLFDRQTRNIITVQAATRYHGHEVPADQNVSHVLLRGPDAVDKVDAITFWPGQSELVEEDGGRKLNQWTPVALEPMEGSVWPFLQHMARIFDSDPVAIGFVLDYMAHLVQRPAQKIQSALLIIGVQGTGKNILAEVLMEVVGRRNARSMTANYLTSEFNSWIMGTLVTVVDELVSDNSRATAGRIKSLITSPIVHVNEKGVPTFDYPNRTHFILLSNDQDAAIVDKDDRRFFVWRSTAPARPHTYYQHLQRWLVRGGYARVLHYLKERDISRFNPFAHPPRTPSHAEIAGYSLSEADTYLASALEAGEAPFARDLIVINHVCEYLTGSLWMRVIPKELGRFLRSAGAVELGQKRIGRAKPRVWAIRNAEHWKNASEDDIAAAYGQPGSTEPERWESAAQPGRLSVSRSGDLSRSR